MRLFLFAIFFGITLSAAHAASVCASDRELEALKIKSLQTSLMVSALSCNQHSSYNAFVQKFKTHLNAQNKVLQHYFTQRYGKYGRTKLDNLMTAIANSESTASLDMSLQKYCTITARLFETTLHTNKNNLSRQIHTAHYLKHSDITACDDTQSVQK